MTTAAFKHYSFDLWLTLIRSNPLFKQERTRFFHQHFNSSNKTLDEVAFVFRKVDLMCNAINEKTGGNIDAEEMYLMVISMINDHDTSFGHVDMAGLMREMDALIYAYPPQLYAAETLPVLERLKQQDCTINILSNTGFIKGGTLRNILAELGLAALVDFQLYSDEEGMSKPNTQFFQRMLHTATGHRAALTAGDVVHIGDNPHADVAGAAAAGISSLLINSNNESILSIFN